MFVWVNYGGYILRDTIYTKANGKRMCRSSTGYICKSPKRFESEKCQVHGEDAEENPLVVCYREASSASGED